MSIEATLERIATALETIAANSGGDAKPAAPAAPAKSETAAAKKKREKEEADKKAAAEKEAADKAAADKAAKASKDESATDAPAETEKAPESAEGDKAMDLAGLKKVLLTEAKLQFDKSSIEVIKAWLKSKGLSSVDNVKPEDREAFLAETRAHFETLDADGNPKDDAAGEDEI